MKKLIAYTSIIMGLAACNKVTVSEVTGFEVTADRLMLKTADTLTFSLTGNPDYITFYSGELHSKYEMSNVNTLAADSNIVTFSTATTAAGGTQPLSANNVLLLASTDFNGTYDSASIKKATWKDISSRAVFATTTTTVASGSVRLEDLTSGTKPVYVAFTYIADTAKTGYLSRKWTLSAFGMKNYFKDTVFALANSYTTGGFYSTSILNPLNVWQYGNTSSITQTLTFNAPAVGSLPDEDWAISRPFNLSQYPPDLGIGIKNPSQNLLTTYKKRFYKAGTYIVTFVAKNQNASDANQVIRQLTITVTP